MFSRCRVMVGLVVVNIDRERQWVWRGSGGACGAEDAIRAS